MVLLHPAVTDAKRGGKMTDLTAIEERIAHLLRAVDDLSDIVARQGRELDRLARLAEMLALREAEREAGALDAPPANQRPPHW